jgi:Na+-transporting NADH:ubiquinone oxidoreductase subunit A
MANHRIRKGLDLPIAGAASGAVVQLDRPETVAYDPRELRGFTARLAAREGEQVKQGQPLLYHKFRPEVVLVSPVSGTVREVRRGPRRVIHEVVVATGEGEAVRHKVWSPGSLASISRQDARDQILKGGGWPFLRTRPLDQVADPTTVPQSILICGTETGPLQPGADVLMTVADKEALQAAVYVLKALTDGAVYLTTTEGSAHPAMAGLQGVEAHTFSGPHPSGDPGVQINLIDPPRGTNRVWWLRAWDAVTIGRLFLEGTFSADRVYAAVGAGLSRPRNVRTLIGAPLAHITGETPKAPVRWLRGSVLTGLTTSADAWAGFYSRAVHVLPEEVHGAPFGWARPMLGTWSFYRAYLAGFTGASKPVDMRPGLWGGHRAIVPTGHYRDVVVTPDIEPSWLFKAILSGDLEQSIKLGMLDITEEEAALCSYICPSKTDFDVILRGGLETYAKEA